MMIFVGSVKDTSNLLDYNQWSGTDYTKDTTSISGTSNKYLSTNEYSKIGENSIKLLSTNSINNISIIYNSSSTGTYTATATLYCLGSSVFRLLAYNDSTLVGDVKCTVSSGESQPSLSLNVSSTITRIIIRAYPNSYTTLYIDNISLIKS